MEHIIKNLANISGRIQSACQRSGRNPSEIKLLLATKTIQPPQIIKAISAGYPVIGENKVQEIKDKFEALKVIPHQKHFIGHLQRNKIKDLLKYNVDCIQSIDRLSLAEKLQQRLSFENKTIEVFIQVNTSNEKSKFGIAPENAVAFIKQVAQFPSIKISGLMTIGLFSAEADKVRTCFKLLKSLQQEIAAMSIPGVSVKELSMGMSGDLEIAIEEGATLIRVGTAIFGKRSTPDSYYWNEEKS